MKTLTIIAFMIIYLSVKAQDNSVLIEENRQLLKQYGAYQRQYDSLSSVLDSYSIRYSYIGIDEELVKLYCQECEYK